MKILAIDNNTGARFYRLIPQLKWMAEHGHEVDMIAHSDKDFIKKIHWADVIIMEMVFPYQTTKEIKKLGKKVIFECDDLLHNVHKSHYNYSDYKGWRKFKMWWETYRFLRICDGFISTNKVLNRAYGWMAKKSLIFPNYSDLSHWLKEPKKNLDPKKIRLLWAGSTSHVGDLNWARPILRAILNKYPQVQFVYIGMGGATTKDLYTQFIYGEDFFEELDSHRRESILPVHPEVWPYILSSLQADIAIAPLEKNYFNSAKSQCKYLEYGLNGIPAVYSKWFYTDVKDGETGFLADSKDEWIEKLSWLIEDGILRETIGKNAREDVINNHDITSFLQNWQSFVELIGKDKHEPTNHPGTSEKEIGR